MTIKRTVNGVEMEFELTDRELFDAYMAQQHKFDLEDISNYFFDIEDADLQEEFLDFQVGDDRMEVWKWFDEHYTGGVAKLAGLI